MRTYYSSCNYFYICIYMIITLFPCKHLGIKRYHYIISAFLGQAKFRKIHRHGTILRLVTCKLL